MIAQIKKGIHEAIYKPGVGESKWLGLDMVQLEAGESFNRKTAIEEVVVVLLSGVAEINVEGGKIKSTYRIGGRPDIFSGSPGALYVGPKYDLCITAVSNMEAAIVSAPSDRPSEPVEIKPESVKVVDSGMESWRRDVRLVVPPGSPITNRMIIGETINPPGKWSGIPAHKHDQISDDENFLEEYYVFKTKPADGHAVQLQYGTDGDNAFMVKDGDAAFFANGYHPTVSMPGVTAGYLWVIAGDKKDYLIKTDPRFSWVGTAESVIKEARKP